MKFFKILLFVFLSALIFSSCELDPDHSIRVKNEYQEALDNVTIGSVSYGTVGSGLTSEYKPVDEGSHELTGTTQSGGTLSGSISVSGNGTHKWTLTIDSAGDVSIDEDK